MMRLLIASALLALSAATASAQGISMYGMWGNEPPERQARPSYLGAPPVLKETAPKALSSGGARPYIEPVGPAIASFPNAYPAGSVIIDTAGRKLYYTLSSSNAFVYPVAVGKQGFTWTGVERVSKVEDWPDWVPPAEMHQRKPGLPLRMTGGLSNPLGAKAIYLGNTLYRIHGTNDPKSIGSAASSGCIRMHNAQVVHLASMVNAQTMVYVVKRLPKGEIAMPPRSIQPAPRPVEAKATAPAPQPAAPAEAPAATEAAPSPPPAATVPAPAPAAAKDPAADDVRI